MKINAADFAYMLARMPSLDVRRVGKLNRKARRTLLSSRFWAKVKARTL